MNSGSLNGRAELGQDSRSERKWRFKYQWLRYLLMRKEGERNLRRAAFLAPEACPEGSIYYGFNYARIGLWREMVFTLRPRRADVFSKVSFDGRGHCSRRLVSGFSYDTNCFGAHLRS